MSPGQKPPFPTYLLPAFSFPLHRRRQPTPTTETAEQSVPPLSSSPTSSTTTSPSSSPLATHFLPEYQIGASPGGLRPAKLPDNQGTPAEFQGTRISIAQPSTLRCGACAADIAFTSQIVSKGFTGRHGRAYLVAPPSRDTWSISSEKKPPISNELINTQIGRSVNRELLTGAHVVADVSCVICGTVLGWKYVDAKELSQRYKIGKYILETKRVVVGVCWEDDVSTQGVEGNLYSGETNDSNDNVIVFDSEDEDECEDLFAGVWDPELVAKRRARRVNTRKKVDNTGL